MRMRLKYVFYEQTVIIDSNLNVIAKFLELLLWGKSILEGGILGLYSSVL